MLNHTSTTAIARTLLLAGILVAVTVLAARTFLPAYAQDPEAGPQPYAENGTDPVAVFSATDPEGQTITWSISEDAADSEDHDDFKISPTGVLEFKNVPNFEDPTSRSGTTREAMNTYTVTVVATDTEEAADKETLTISVTNVDEDGEITLGTLQPLEKVALVATLRDPDGRVIADGSVVLFTSGTNTATTTWEWTRSSSDSGPWNDVVATSTETTITGGEATRSYTPGKEDIGSYLRVIATYTDGHGEAMSLPTVSANPVLKNRVNDAPVFRYTADDTVPDMVDIGDEVATGTAIVRGIDENSAAGDPVGGPVVAYDEDDDTLTYRFDTDAPAGPDHQFFDIDRETGQITVGDHADLDLDFEVNPPDYSVVVIAEDPSGQSDSIEIDINEIDVPEAPAFTGTDSATRISLNELTSEQLTVDITRNGTVEDTSVSPISGTTQLEIERYDALDDDDENDGDAATLLTWSLSGPDGVDFVLCAQTPGSACDDPEGNDVELRFKQLPDYEASLAASNNNVYRLTVTATDSTGMSVPRNVQVTVTNENETGDIEFNHIRPEVGTGITASLSDPDRVLRITGWQWLNDTAEINGATSATYRPTDDDVNDPLTVSATYNDGHGAGKTLTSDNADLRDVQAEDTGNPNPNAPEFLDGRGIATTSIDFTIAEHTTSPVFSPPSLLGTVSATDNDDSGDLIYSLSGTDARFFEIRDWLSGDIFLAEGTILDSENDNSYRVTVTAMDPSRETDTITVNIEVTNREEAPVIEGGASRTIDYPEIKNTSPNTDTVFTFMASDPEDKKANKPLTWTLLTDGQRNSFDLTEGGVLTFKSPPDFEDDDASVNNAYMVTVQVTDSGDVDGSDPQMDTQGVTVNIGNVDERGTVTLSTLQPLEARPLTATVEDIDGELTKAEWTWERSPNGSSGWTVVATTSSTDFSDGRATSVYMPVEDDITNYLRASVIYTDPQGPDKPASEVSENAVLKDLNNDPPVFNHVEGNEYTDNVGQIDTTTEVIEDMPIPAGLRLVRRVAEDSSAGTDVGGPVQAFDEDGDTLTYALSGDDVSLFTIVRGSGQIQVKDGPPLQYDGSATPKRTYTVEVTATDPLGEDAEVTVSVLVTNVPEDPVIADGGPATISLNEITDQLREATITRDGTEDATPVDPTTSDGEVELATYMATDEEDEHDNDADTVVEWSLTGPDCEEFLICAESAGGPCTPATGYDFELRFREAPNFESPTDSDGDNEYHLTVNVTDSIGGTDTHDVMVTVTNVDEPANVILSNRQPEVGAALKAELGDDPDGGVRNISWQWAYAEPGAPATFIDIDGATSGSYTPAPGDSRATLRATASYRDNASKPDDSSTTETDESLQMTEATSANPVKQGDELTNGIMSANEPPEFPDVDATVSGIQKDQVRYVVENAIAEVLVVANEDGSMATPPEDPVVALDMEGPQQNVADTLTYTLSGSDAVYFTIDTDDGQFILGQTVPGQIRVGANADLNYEAKNTYTVSVTATDPSNDSDTITVTINIVPVNEPPVISERGLVVSGPGSPEFAENGTGDVAEYTASGPDSAGATWHLGGDDAGDFNLSSAGVLSFAATPDYEEPADLNEDNQYRVTVMAQMGTFSASLPVTVIVTDVEEDGSVTISSLNNEVKVGVELTADLGDGDEIDPGSVTWQWTRDTSDTGSFTDVITGETDNTYTPVDADVGSYLRATANYADSHGSGMQASAVTASAVLAASTAGTDGTVSLSPSSGLVSGDSVSASLTDADNPTNQVWQWQRSSDRSTNWTTISGATLASYETTNDDGGHSLRASVTYDDDSDTGQTAGPTATTDRVKLHRYDGNASGVIERDEVIDAIRDYLFAADPTNPTTTRDAGNRRNRDSSCSRRSQAGHRLRASGSRCGLPGPSGARRNL